MVGRVVEREATHLYARRPDGAGDDLVRALLRVHRVEGDAVEAARRATGLGRSEFQALRYLLQAARDGRPVGPKDLHVMVGLSHAAVTKVTDGLEQAGLVERRQHPSDRRAQLLTATPKAEEVIAAGYHRFHAALVTAVERQDGSTARLCAAALHDIADELARHVAEQP
jgi:DNA-binding MarR family transcriptional regulator